jgi:antibiotic biosynthesis monooxygenase (ABM) superfamily enzyme
MTNNDNPPVPTPPPSRHELALMIWLCVFPTLTVINVTLAGWLAPMPPVLRTFLLATIAVPIVTAAFGSTRSLTPGLLVVQCV